VLFFRFNVDNVLNTVLTRPDSTLRSLELESNLRAISLGPGTTPRNFKRFLTAICSSKLEHLACGVHNDRGFYALLEAIPNMKSVNSLTLMVDHPDIILDAVKRQNLLRSIKRNFNLRSVTFPVLDIELAPLLNEAERRQLEFYMNRNVQLERWVENPALVPRLLWSQAIKLAKEAGKNALSIAV